MAGLQQVVAWANSNPVLYHCVVLLGHTKLSEHLGLTVFLFNFWLCNVDYEFQINMFWIVKHLEALMVKWLHLPLIANLDTQAV